MELLSDQVLIKPLQSTPRSSRISTNESRIVMPGQLDEPARTGEVLAVGPGAWVPGTWWKVKENGVYEWRWFPGYRNSVDVHTGDIVLFGRYSGLEFKQGEDRPELVGLRIMRESEILAKIGA